MALDIYFTTEKAYQQMKATKQMFGKTGGRKGYHFVLSLKSGEGTLEIMYDIAMRFAKEAFSGEYEAVVAVHTDREHLHAHIIINGANMVTGYKFQCRDGDWKYKYQPITNKLCEEYGLHITPAEYSKEPKNMARPQWEREQAFSKWIKQDALFCAISAENMEHFIFLMEKLGFEVKQGKHIAVKVPGMKRFKRLDTISEDLSRESLEAMFRYGDESLASPVNRTVSLLPVRKTVLTPYQRKCYSRMYRLRLAEKKRFTWKQYYDRVCSHSQRKPEPFKWVYEIDTIFNDSTSLSPAVFNYIVGPYALRIIWGQFRPVIFVALFAFALFKLMQTESEKKVAVAVEADNEKIKYYKGLLDQGVISAEEFEDMKSKIKKGEL